MNVTPVLIRIVAAFGIAVAAGGLSALLARTHKQLCAFISLGAGTLLGVGFAASRRSVWRHCAGGSSCWQRAPVICFLPWSADTFFTFVRPAPPVILMSPPRIIWPNLPWR